MTVLDPETYATTVFGRELTNEDRARWVRFNEDCRRDPRLLRVIRGRDPKLYRSVLSGLRVLAIEARSQEWRSPIPGVGGRPEQLIPGTPGSFSDRTDWLTFFLMGGRGSGKSRTGAEGVAEILNGRRWIDPPVGALVGQTLDAVRVDMVENTLLRVLPPGSWVKWNRGPCELFLANGGYLRGFSSEAPRKLRGPNFHFAWCDEMGTWKDRDRSPGALDTTWSNLKLAVRLDDHGRWRPRIIGTTTPRPCRLIRNVDPKDPLNPGPGLYDDPLTVVSHMSTLANLSNLADHYLEAVIEPLRGTRLFDQEVMGELKDIVVGALWTPEQVDRMVFPEVDRRDLSRVVVAVDPSVGAGLGDECGIVVVGLGLDGRAYILEDCSVRGPASEWVVRVRSAFIRWNASVVVVEVNNGGELVAETLGRYAANLPIQEIYAKENKTARAEPVALLSDRDRLRFSGGAFDLLRNQMTTWDGTGESPDRLDAMVYGALFLLPVETAAGSLFTVVRGRPLR